MGILLTAVAIYLVCGAIVVPIRLVADLRKLGTSVRVSQILVPSDRTKIVRAWIGLALHVLVWPVLFFFWPRD